MKEVENDNRIVLVIIGITGVGCLGVLAMIVLAVGGLLLFRSASSERIPEVARTSDQHWPQKLPTQMPVAPSFPSRPSTPIVPAPAAPMPPMPVAPVPPMPVGPSAVPPANAAPPAIPQPALPSAPSIPRGPEAAQRPAARPVSRPAGELVYRWNPGDEHTYRITINAEINGDDKNVNGWCSYTVGEPSLQGYSGETESTGTALVVAPNGFLVTCAHVIEDAERISVTIEGREYEARVVEADPEIDLALLQVDADDLTAVPLGNSDEVELAQDVRVFGFPLSDVLGKGLKITSGSVAGFIDEPGDARRFQIDAAVNPGNSGGPVVDAQGRVIGIASAKLVGVEVTRVGFAVPSNEARRMLRDNGVSLMAATKAPPLTGPQVAAAVRPAVAMVAIRLGDSAAYEVIYAGGYQHQVEVSGSSRFPFPSRIGPRGPTRALTTETVSANGKLRATDFGEISDYEGDKQFPFALGPVGTLAIEDIHRRGRRAWGSESQTELRVIERSNDGDFPFGPRFGPMGPRFGPYGRDEPDEKVKASYPAVERVRYEIEHEDADEAVIKKKYEFRTLESSDDPYLSIQGSGTLTFDKRLGMPRRLEFRSTYVRNSENVSLRIPMNLAYELRDPAEVAEERRVAAERLAKAREEAEARAKERAAAETVARTTPNPDKVDELVNKVKSSPVPLVFQHLDALAKLAVVEDRRDDVVELAAGFLDADHDWARSSALKVIIQWAPEERRVSLLNDFLRDPERDVPILARQLVFETLGESTNADVPQVLAIRLKVQADRRDAAKALVASGPAAEDAVLVLLATAPDVRREVADILKEIGTAKSLPALENAARDESSASIKRPLQAALEAIRKRQQQGT